MFKYFLKIIESVYFLWITLIIDSIKTKKWKEKKYLLRVVQVILAQH